jgi:hypothetical protein
MQAEAQKKHINFRKVSLDTIGGVIMKEFKESHPEIKDNEEIFFSCWG